jgi:hypothetical protein
MMFAIATFLHGLFAILSLALVGAEAMYSAQVLGIFSYSCYLTLREWTIVLYLIITTMSAFYLAYAGAGTLAESTQILGLYLGIGVDLVTVYYCGRAYFYFRKTGGIHGVARTGDLPEERFVKGAGVIAGTGAAALNAQLSKDNDAKQKEADDDEMIKNALKNSPK